MGLLSPELLPSEYVSKEILVRDYSLKEIQASRLLEGKRALLCENESLVLMYLNQVFHHLGAIVIAQTRTREEAVEIALAERPEIILLSQTSSYLNRRPDIDCIEATRHILTAYPACIILMTSYDNRNIQDEAITTGVQALLPKPFTLKELTEVLWQSFSRFLPSSSDHMNTYFPRT